MAGVCADKGSTIADVIIIGAGPAGLAAAYRLQGKKVVVFEEGLKPLERLQAKQEKRDLEFSNTLCGVGGAGLFSDGKLNFAYRIGKTDLTDYMSPAEAQNLIQQTEDFFNKFGMDGQVYPTNMDKAHKYQEKAIKSGIHLMIIKQKHLGSDKLPHHIHNLTTHLEQNGVEFRTNCKVHELIVEDRFKGVRTDHGEFWADNVIVCPGRSGAKWWYEQAQKLNLDVEFGPVEIGIRVEVPNEIMDNMTDVIYDPTLFMYSDTYDDELRTFCTNKGGYIAKENYKDFVCVNGHAYKDKKSNNTNFALLSKVVLTKPITNSHDYGCSIGRLATTIGGGKPILQRYTDLKRGRRSTWERIENSFTEPTLKDVTPGDISMALPKRVVTNLIEAIEKLNRILPGVASNNTLLYAPEIKFFNTKFKLTKGLQTTIPGVHVAGDGAGVSGNIVGAAATGFMAADSILKNLNQVNAH